MSRPKINPSINETGHLLNRISLIGIIVYLAYILYTFTQLPDKIPTHFNLQGQPDDWSSKWIIFVLPLVVLGIYSAFNYLTQRPYLFNYAQKITEENAADLYRSAKMLLITLRCIIIYTFFFISWQTVRISQGQAEGLGSWFLPLFLCLIIGTIVFYFRSTSTKK